MRLFGQEVDPWDLFLVFILLLGATGSFPAPDSDGNRGKVTRGSSLQRQTRPRPLFCRTRPGRVGTLPAR